MRTRGRWARHDRDAADLVPNLGHEIPPEGGRRHAHRRHDRGQLAARGPRAGLGRVGARALGAGVLRGARGVQVPARRPHPRRRRCGAAGHALQLLRDGADCGRHDRDLRQSEGSSADHAAGRRHRLRLLNAPAQGCAGQGRRRRRIGAASVHGCLGCDVPHHHERRLSPRCDDGLPALRSPRHRGLHRGQARPRPAPHVQPLGAGDRCVHAGGQGQRFVGARLRGRRLPHRLGAHAVGADHPLDLRLRRARRDLHRPHQPDQQPRLLRGDLRNQSLRRAAAAALWRLPAGLDQPGEPGAGPLRAGRVARHGGAGGAHRHRRQDARQRDRLLALSHRGAAGGGTSKTAHRARRHRARGRPHHVPGALRQRRGERPDRAVDGWPAAGGISGVCRACGGEGCLPPLRRRALCREPDDPAPRRRRAGGDRRIGGPQRAAHLGGADGHDLAFGRQRLVRRRAGVQPLIHAQRAHAGRHAPGGNRGRPRLSAVSPPQGRFGAAAGLLRRRSVAPPGRSPHRPGAGPGLRRQLHLQDHQLP